MIRIILSMLVLTSLMMAHTVLSLGEAFDLALHNEPGYQVNTYKTKAVGETVNQAKSKLYPQIQLVSSAGKYEYEAYYDKKQVSETSKTYSLSVNQSIYHPELWRTVEQSNTRFEGANEDLKKQSQKLGIDVASAYIDVLGSENNVSKIEMQKSFLTAKYTKIKHMFDLGLASKLDYLDAKIALDKVLSDSSSAKRQLRVSKVYLSHMIGYPADTLLLQHPKCDLKKLKNVKDSWETKLSDNPDYKIANLSKKVAKDEVDIRFYDHYPKVDLLLDRSENNTHDIVAHKYDNKAFVQMTIPLYQGGYVSSRVQEATLLLHAAQEDVAYTKKVASDRFEMLWSEYESSIESIQILRDSEQTLKLYVEAMQKSEKEGIKSDIDVLEAKAKYETARADLNGAIYSLLINQLGLLDVTGNLTVESVTELQSTFLDR